MRQLSEMAAPDEIYFTDRGVILEQGPPAAFFSEARDPRTRAFLSQIL